ncbi:unnamed protein product [Fusarium equiseti]|uniref:Uncharacterized protein n=1 Tax=Fusarium equiseti TaxID=61235 RepID=A0A8J2NF98_FUSEQ|nr:unnamed protein product [Fusarium equiseti]
METPNPIFSAWPLLLARAEGLLAGLIYLDSTATAIDHFSNPHSSNPQILRQWALLRIVRAKLDEARQRLIAAKDIMYLEGRDDTLDSFVKPTRFYEVAISGYRNVLLHTPPTTLGEVLAVCSLSHVILQSANNQIGFDFSHLEIWGNAIINHNHRQAFHSLITAICLEPQLTSQDCCSFSACLGRSHSLQPSYQEELSTISTPQEDDMANDIWGSFWDIDYTTHDFLASNSLSGGQTADCSHLVSKNTQLTSTSTPDLQGSRIIRNLTHFLEDCGELTDTLVLSSPSRPSSRGETVQLMQSEVRNLIEPLYMQRLRNDDSFKVTNSQAILSIIDSFTNLGYLQSTTEARDYMLLLGKVCAPLAYFSNRGVDSRV